MIVLCAVTEKQVIITDQFATTPITGRQAIFAKVNANAPTETRYSIEIVGIYTTLEVCARARAAHAATHPGRKYVQKVAALNDSIPVPVTPSCIRCSTEIAQGSYCGPCHAQYLAETRAADPLNGAPDEVPLIQTTVGQALHG